MLRLSTAAALGAAALAVAAGPAAAAPTHTLELGAADGAAATVTGAAGNGANVSYLVNTGPLLGTCGSDLQTKCESALVKVEQRKSGTTLDKNLKFRLDGFGPASDFDLRVYDANAAGVRGTYLGSPRGDSTYDETTGLGTDDPRNTSAGDFERKVVKSKLAQAAATDPVFSYYLVEVPYFLTANDKYSLTVSWTKEAAF